MNAWMKRLSNNQHLLALAAALIATGGLVVACGGGGGGGGGTAPTSTRSMGEITAKASVTVNGVKFETTGAQIVMDGGVPVTGDDSDLRVGMMVEVAGTINADGVTGTATAVNFEDTIQGPVTAGSRTVVDDSFDIMGKKVFVVQDTTIDDSTGLPRGFNDISGEVEVSAGIDDQGRIVATHIELKPAGAESEVTGAVDSINPLVVAGIPVTIDASTTFPNFPAGTTSPAVGDFVEVKGSFVAPSLTATSIELKTGIADDDNFHFEGFVISGTADSFALQGRHLDQQLNVTTTSATSFEGGPRGDLIVGTKVEVEGVLTGGTIAATKVKFRENVRIQMTAGAASADLSTVTLTNLSAVTVQTNALTRDDDNSTPLGIDAGDRLEIRGRKAADGSIIATRLRVDQPSSNPERVILRGPVDSVSGSTIVLLGVTVNTAGGAQFRPNDDNSNDDNAQSMTQAQFMAQVKAGTVIKVRGVLTGDNLLAADELELED